MDDSIPQMQPWLDEREADAVASYLRSGGWLTEFQETRRFAAMIADVTGARFCSILSNGTVTLTAALLAMGVGEGDEVVVPAYTMIATANAVLMACGARPVFADVEPETMGLDADCLERCLGRRTKAVILVSINGRYPQGLDRILELCKVRGIPILEDAAQSLGSHWRGRHAGRFGAAGSFSFSMPKIVTTGQGGALITDDEDLHRKIELVRNFGRAVAGVDRHTFIGGNFKFTDLQAVVGIEQMKKLADRVARKKRIYRQLEAGLAGQPGLSFFETADETVPWFNDILVDDRDGLQAHLKGLGIGSRAFYPVVPTQAPYDLSWSAFPSAQRLANHGLWLPSYAQMTGEELNRIVDGVRGFCSR